MNRVSIALRIAVSAAAAVDEHQLLLPRDKEHRRRVRSLVPGVMHVCGPSCCLSGYYRRPADKGRDANILSSSEHGSWLLDAAVWT